MSHHRSMLNAIARHARSGAAWRDLPGRRGNRNTAFRRFRRWCQGGVRERLLATLSGNPDYEFLIHLKREHIF